MSDSKQKYTEKFRAYFQRRVALEAAHTLKKSASIGFQIGDENFVFRRVGMANEIETATAQAMADCDLLFTLTANAADRILKNPSENIGEIGVEIARLIVSSDPQEKVHLKLNAGFLTFMSNGYWGVMGAGGKAFTAFLASRGLSGVGAIKKIIQKLRK